MAMLNAAFPLYMKGPENDHYVLHKKYWADIITQNTSTNCGMETRTDAFHGKYISDKLQLLGLSIKYFENKVVMDVCGGSGFLSYHLLLGGIKPKKLVICDISQSELNQAKKLIDPIKKSVHVEYRCENIADNSFDANHFDCIIGNSFLHHFYNIPAFLDSIHKILKQGGHFISTHEPSIAATAVEAGSILVYLYYLFRGSKYIDDIRYKGDSIKENNLGDVWMFETYKLTKVFENAGFQELHIKYGNIFQGLLSNNLGLYPIPIPLGQRIKRILTGLGIYIDNKLRYLIGGKYFAEIIFCVEK